MDIAEPSGCGNSAQLREAASCLLAFLSLHGRSGRDLDVLMFLAEETLRRLDEGKPPRFNNIAIQSAVMRSNAGEASSWLSPIWKKITTKTLLAHEEGLQAFARKRGLGYYPWAGKLESSGGAGNQTLYYLDAKPLPAAEPDPVSMIDLPEPDLVYIPAERVEPSWWARWLFDKERSAVGWRKALVVWVPFIWFVSFALFGVLGIWLLSQSSRPVTAQDLALLVIVATVSWSSVQTAKWFVRLIDDRIVLAPYTMVGFKEFGVCLELAKAQSTTQNAPRPLRLVKYGAQCPICGAEVLLDAGEPDFPRRIVGRCQEAPREHVFSFDRIAHCGYWLR